MSLRTDRASEALKEALMDIIQRDLKDPDIGIASITSLSISKDLTVAQVGISVLGDEQTGETTVAALKRAKGHMRRELSARLRLRVVPDLIFRYDKSAAYSVHIAKILNELNDKEEEGGDV
jgi:ribosome-binding factor A